MRGRRATTGVLACNPGATPGLDSDCWNPITGGVVLESVTPLRQVGESPLDGWPGLFLDRPGQLAWPEIRYTVTEARIKPLPPLQDSQE
jgi:hypothetical protein